MKNIILILIVILIFFICGTIGYQLANRVGSVKEASPTPGPGLPVKGEQHNLVVVYVDQLDSPKPKLVSVWFASLFFMKDVPPILTFAQIYPTTSNKNLNQTIAKSFALDARKEPAAGFLKNLGSFKIAWEGYILVDHTTVQRVLEWINGQGEDYTAVLSGSSNTSTNHNQVVLQSCKLISGIDKRQSPPLEWGDLVPAHFRSNLRMEDALAYWHKITTTAGARCEVLPAR